MLRYLLGEVAEPVKRLLDDRYSGIGGAQLVGRGKTGTSKVQPWRNRWHLKYRVPVSAGEERLRVQFYADHGKPYFSVEARYEHPKESLEDVEPLSAILRSRGFGVGNDGWGHFWAKVTPASAVVRDASTVDHMIEHAVATLDDLTHSGLIEALALRTPSTPTSPAPLPED